MSKDDIECIENSQELLKQKGNKNTSTKFSET